MFDPNRLHTVKINWSYPREYDNDFNGFENHPLANAKGLYCISRKWAGKNEKIIYIGKTTRSFKKRIKEHIEKDISEWTKVRGKFVIRLGSLDEKDLEGFEEYNQVIEDIESALIFEVDPDCNRQKSKSYTRMYDLQIINMQYRGLITKEICNRDHG